MTIRRNMAPQPDWEALIACANRLAASLSLPSPPPDKVRSKMQEVLFERHALARFERRVFTLPELRNLLLADLWLLVCDCAGVPMPAEYREDSELDREVERAVYGRDLLDERTHAALMIEDLHAREGGWVYDKLHTLVDDEGILMPPGTCVRKGAQERNAALAELLGPENTGWWEERSVSCEELLVCGDYAFEWGYAIFRYRVTEKEPPRQSRRRFMRVLRRQANGDWKVYRAMWQEPASEGTNEAEAGG